MRRFEIGVSEAIPVAIRVSVPGRGLCPMARVLLLLAGLTCGPMWSAVGQCSYTWQIIPNAPSGTCFPEAINDHGQVTGSTANGSGNRRCFVWSAEQGTRLIPLPSGVTSMTGHDINNLGHVVGTMETSISALGNVPFFWDGQNTHQIEMPVGALNGYAYALNDSDEVVGQFDTGTGVRPFHWQGGVFTNIGVGIPVTSVARDINDLGEIIGDVIYPGAIYRAVKFVAAGVEFLPEPPGFLQIFAGRLNNNGLITGTGRNSSNRWRGLIWSGGAVEVLEPPPPFDRAGVTPVNDAGQIMGAFSIGPFSSNRLYFMIWPTGRMVELSPLVSPQIPAILGAGPHNEAGEFTMQVENGAVYARPQWIAGDLTGDCAVGFDDLIFLLSNFGSPQGSFPRGDVDRDGDVDLTDLSTLLSHWGT